MRLVRLMSRLGIVDLSTFRFPVGLLFYSSLILIGSPSTPFASPSSLTLPPSPREYEKREARSEKRKAIGFYLIDKRESDASSYQLPWFYTSHLVKDQRASISLTPSCSRIALNHPLGLLACPRVDLWIWASVALSKLD
jgi:hypothetical protein